MKKITTISLPLLALVFAVSMCRPVRVQSLAIFQSGNIVHYVLNVHNSSWAPSPQTLENLQMHTVGSTVNPQGYHIAFVTGFPLSFVGSDSLDIAKNELSVFIYSPKGALYHYLMEEDELQDTAAFVRSDMESVVREAQLIYRKGMQRGDSLYMATHDPYMPVFVCDEVVHIGDKIRYNVTMMTNPDHTHIEIDDDLQFLRIEYVHHGSTDSLAASFENE